jgi:hypothetical protein
MTAAARGWRLALFASAAVGLSCCGGGSGSNNSNSAGSPPPSGPNVVAMTVDSGPAGNSINQAYTTVKVCAPGSTTNCQTIDHVWVDTGSAGLRLIGTQVTASLPAFMDPNNSNNTIANCVQFVSAYSWGAMRIADVTIGNETAASVPIHVIGDTAGGAVPAPTSAPSTCTTGTSFNTVAELGANGLLGVGLFLQDCGANCAPPFTAPAGDPYYSCSAGSCAQVVIPVSQQLQNPVGLFATDNNGVLIQMPVLGPGGAATATGSLIFGINTQSNNMLGSALVFLADPSVGSIRTTTSYGDMNEPFSFIDSGSNGFFFNDASLATCTGTPPNGFYCANASNLSATMLGYNSGTPSYPYIFSIKDESTLSGTAFNTLGGPFGTCNNTTGPTCTFDWGLPFFYGRSVFTAVEGTTINGNPGPFFAASTP